MPPLPNFTLYVIIITVTHAAMFRQANRGVVMTTVTAPRVRSRIRQSGKSKPTPPVKFMPWKRQNNMLAKRLHELCMEHEPGIPAKHTLDPGNAWQKVLVGMYKRFNEMQDVDGLPVWDKTKFYQLCTVNGCYQRNNKIMRKIDAKMDNIYS